MLVHFPVTRWSLETACDVITAAGLKRRCSLTIGLITALPAALAGFMDFNGASGKIGTGWQGLYKADGNGLPLSDGDVVAKQRLGSRKQCEVGAGYLSVLGLLVRAAAGHHGGELVYRFGAGVSKKASK
jgi:hypothetical protein